jgi:hypothetical protein
MQRSAVLVTGIVLSAAVAFAAADIPTRYSGSFPSVGRLSNVTGSFTGSTLALKGTYIVGTRFTTASGTLACARASATQTRCAGVFRTTEGEAGRRTLLVTWSGGRPVAMVAIH